MLKWYTYVLIDPRTGLPFYVGKGTGKRMYDHRENHNNRFMRERIVTIKEAGLNVIYEKWFESDDEVFCYWMEIYLIAFFGRENLCNLTLGGQGPPSGEASFTKDPKVRAKLCASHKGQVPWMKGKTHPPESRKLIKAARALQTNVHGPHLNGELNPFFGKKHPEENLVKMRAAKLGRKIPEVTCAKMSKTHLLQYADPAFMEAFRAAHAQAHVGKKQSETTRAKQRKAALGRKHNKVSIAKMRWAKTGKKAPEATHAKMRESQLRRWAKRKVIKKEECVS